MNTGTRNFLRGALAIAAAMLLQAMPFAASAGAAPELTGVWQGKLAVDASTSLTVQFTFNKGSNGAYTAVLNSPDNPGLKDTPVTGVTWDGTNLKMQVPSLSGTFAGALKGGSIGGEWTQPGAKLPLALAPFQKPVVSAANAKALTGNWNGVLTVQAGITQNINIEFKQAAGGIEGVFGLPDQGAKLPFKDVVIENGEVSMKIPQGNVVLDYKGKLVGDTLNGRIKIPNPALPADGLALNLKRGEYKPAVAALKLSAENFAALKGKWQGQLEVPNPQTQQKQTLNLILRFETNAKGEYLAFVDNPEQKLSGIVVNEVTLAEGKLVVKIAAIRGEYNATLAGKTMTGEWSQGGGKLPLVMTRQ
jgi:hypothetical protein